MRKDARGKNLESKTGRQRDRPFPPVATTALLLDFLDRLDLSLDRCQLCFQMLAIVFQIPADLLFADTAATATGPRQCHGKLSYRWVGG